MVLGSLLTQRDSQYIADRDDKGTWRILDTWHIELREAPVDFDVPDDHAAVTLVTEGAFLALIKEATTRGILDSALDGGTMPLADYDKACDERDALKEELEVLRISSKDTSLTSSEAFRLNDRKMDLIERAMNLNQLDPETIQMISRIGGNSEV